MNGSIFIPVGQDVIIGSISPDANELLEVIMQEWDKHSTVMKEMAPDYEPSIYGFAYWLCRWSGLIQPNTKPEEVPS